MKSLLGITVLLALVSAATALSHAQVRGLPNKDQFTIRSCRRSHCGQPKRRLPLIVRWLGGFLILYVASYATLSFTGGWVVTESGEVRMMTAVADIFQWQPRYGSCQRFRSVDGDYTLRADALGYFYSPLILLDQRFVHRTIPFISADGQIIDPLPAPPLAQYHSLRANRWHGRFPYEKPSNPK